MYLRADFGGSVLRSKFFVFNPVFEMVREGGADVGPVNRNEINRPTPPAPIGFFTPNLSPQAQ
jgi:hypothetical protein